MMSDARNPSQVTSLVMSLCDILVKLNDGVSSHEILDQ